MFKLLILEINYLFHDMGSVFRYNAVLLVTPRFNMRVFVISFDDIISSIKVILYDFAVVFLHEIIPVNFVTKLLCPVITGKIIMNFFLHSLFLEKIHTLIYVYLYSLLLGVITYVQNTTVLSRGLESVVEDYRKNKDLKKLGLF